MECYRCFCITKRRLNRPQTVAVRKGCSQAEGVLNPGKSQKDASLRKVPWWKHRWLLSCREKSLLFSLFLLGKCFKKPKPCTDYFKSKRFRRQPLYIIRLPYSSQDRWIAEELPEDFIPFWFSFIVFSFCIGGRAGRHGRVPSFLWISTKS